MIPNVSLALAVTHRALTRTLTLTRWVLTRTLTMPLPLTLTCLAGLLDGRLVDGADPFQIPDFHHALAHG